MKVKFGLRLKFSLLFAGIMLFLCLVSYFFLYNSYNNMFHEQLLAYAESVAELVSGMTEETKLRQYVETRKTDKEYDILVNQMMILQKKAGFYYLYLVVVEERGKGYYVCDLKLEDKSGNQEITFNHVLGEENPLENKFTGLNDVLESKEPSKKFNRIDYFGVRLDSAYVPILDKKGEVGAFVGVDFKHETLVKDIRKEIRGILIPMVVLMLPCFFLLIGIIRVVVLGPIYSLKEHAKQVSEGSLGLELQIKGHDELSEIMDVFNHMSKSIAESMTDMQALNEAYYRYVPSRILTLLGKESIQDICLGDEVNTRLSVFSFQLADFDRNIRKKSTREMIDAINNILKISVPVIAEHEGMVESFQNAGFTALYDGSPASALLSAVLICQRMNQMVDRQELDKNRAEIGIAYGQVTLGIVGENQRMAAITVSPFRDTACFLQNIAEKYQSHILVTQEAADAIPGFFENYHIRTLGFLYNTYTGYTGKIYDVYDGDRRETYVMKEATKENFEKGVEAYCLRDFKLARQYFIKVLKGFRRDRAAKEYLRLCDAGSRKQDADIYFARME